MNQMTLQMTSMQRWFPGLAKSPGETASTAEVMLEADRATTGDPCVLEPPMVRHSALRWLLGSTYQERFLDRIFDTLCRRLCNEGTRISRAAVLLQVEHPQWLGLRMLWRPDMDEPDLRLRDESRAACESDEERYAASLGDFEMMRIRLGARAGAGDLHPFLRRMREQHFTDYVAWPLHFTLGKRHFISFASKHPDGFQACDIAYLAELVPALTCVMEIRVKNRLARSLLCAYVGSHAGEAVLAGALHRGNGATVEAAILVVDLRGFTTLSDCRPRDEVLTLLNDYFDTLSDPIERNGGEILKFMGDGLLAIFPQNASAAFRAVREICLNTTRLNADRAATGRTSLEFGIGANFGDVMYGNIGSRKRLDFTVIGPAVNVATRLEALTKQMRRRALFSGSFVAKANAERCLHSCGKVALRGVGEPVEVFSFADPRNRTGG
jgi:adenylate cyclase